MTGIEYQVKTIRGCCQGDWNYLYCPATYDAKTIECIETEYFNTGSEYMVHDDDTDPEGPENITGYCVYVHEWTDDGIRKELANCIGCNPEDLVIYNIAGTYTSYKYEQA